MENIIPKSSNRLISLDVMRGLIMILLAGESCLVYENLHALHLGGVADGFIKQFFHAPWRGLHFWDCVQPGFMLMAGTAMYISYSSKMQKGITWKQNLKHIVIRSVKLFALGTGLHCVYAGKLVFELWNVLTQLSVTTLIAYLIVNKSFWFQIGFSAALLIIADVLYRTISIPGFDQPFVEFHNFGAYMDTFLMHKINTDGWVAINVIPTAAHTIWGVLAGKLLISKESPNRKIMLLVIAGIIALVIGFGLDISNITPIIKRISTSSFALASGGCVLLIMAFMHWLFDIKQLNKYAWICVVVGTNSIFIYLFFETVGAQWFNNAMGIFIKGFLGFSALPLSTTAVISSLATLFAEWYLCYFLSKHKLFIKI